MGAGNRDVTGQVRAIYEAGMARLERGQESAPQNATK